MWVAANARPGFGKVQFSLSGEKIRLFSPIGSDPFKPLPEKCHVFQRPVQRHSKRFSKQSSVNFNRQNTFHYKSISKQLTMIENDSNSARSSLDVASRVAIGREIERNFCSFCVVCRFGNLAAHYLLFCSFVGRDCCSNWTWFMVFLFVCSCLHLL